MTEGKSRVRITGKEDSASVGQADRAVFSIEPSNVQTPAPAIRRRCWKQRDLTGDLKESFQVLC